MDASLACHGFHGLTYSRRYLLDCCGLQCVHFNFTHLSVTHNSCQAKENAVLMTATGIGLGLLIYWKITQVLWGALPSEPTVVIQADVTSRICPCSPPVRYSARNASRAPLSATLRVKEVYTFDRSARCANQRRTAEMGRAILSCNPLLSSSRRTAPGSCLRGRMRLVLISA